MPKQFMQIRDLGQAGAYALLDRARCISRSSGVSPEPSLAPASEFSHDTVSQTVLSHNTCFAGKTAALVFETSPSGALFETAVRRLGGLVRRGVASREDGTETPEETAALFSRGADALILRARSRSRFERLAAASGVPVLNAGDEAGDPCRVLGDLLFALEREGDLARTRVAWIGEANGVASSWIEASIYFPFELFMAVPPGHEPDRSLLGLALQAGAKIFLTYEPHMAVQGAGYICINDAGREAGPDLTAENLAAPGAVLLDGCAANTPAKMLSAAPEGEAAVPNRYGLSSALASGESRLCLIEALLEWLVS